MKRAEQIMYVVDVESLLSPELTLADAANVLAHGPAGAALVGTAMEVSGGLTWQSALIAASSHDRSTQLAELVHPVPAVSSDADTRQLREVFDRHKADLVAVVDADNHPVGLITEAVLVEVEEQQDTGKFRENAQVVTVQPPADEGGQQMAKHKQQQSHNQRLSAAFRGDGSLGSRMRRTVVLIAGPLFVLATTGYLIYTATLAPSALLIPFIAATAIVMLLARLIWPLYSRRQPPTEPDKTE
ncbi:hypothetical protein C3489_11270 [Streptomyces sp. Ru71]|uniref:CBS domain-containing protein n=1 Tax=Streptomyces sp. Ru71 TaxID=2080746 RepID=UPI000CDD673E|nr:CBS domain-containing protein [Streptomyces sp. Ru71]POX55345.1 hypothetical protein C3489_11270 [Streptomyces sp. Ru71]